MVSKAPHSTGGSSPSPPCCLNSRGSCSRVAAKGPYCHMPLNTGINLFFFLLAGHQGDGRDESDTRTKRGSEGERGGFLRVGDVGRFLEGCVPTFQEDGSGWRRNLLSRTHRGRPCRCARETRPRTHGENTNRLESATVIYLRASNLNAVMQFKAVAASDTKWTVMQAFKTFESHSGV